MDYHFDPTNETYATTERNQLSGNSVELNQILHSKRSQSSLSTSTFQIGHGPFVLAHAVNTRSFRLEVAMLLVLLACVHMVTI
jgi:hypothetical protein